MRLFIATLALVLGLSGGEAKARVDGNKLHEWCGLDEQRWGHGACDGFLAGASGTFHYWMSLEERKFFCEPNGVTGGQLRDIVTKWLIENPAKRHLAGEVLVGEALIDAFPCPK